MKSEMSEAPVTADSIVIGDAWIRIRGDASLADLLEAASEPYWPFPDDEDQRS